MAAVDYFLKIDGIPGESTDSKHKNEIDIESWSWGEANSGSHAYGGGGGAGKVSVQDFNFTMHVNKASPKLFLACATGQHIKEALLTCRKAGKVAGLYCANAERAVACAKRGVRFLAVGSDLGFLRAGTAAQLKVLKG